MGLLGPACGPPCASVQGWNPLLGLVKACTFSSKLLLVFEQISFSVNILSEMECRKSLICRHTSYILKSMTFSVMVSMDPTRHSFL